MILVTPADQLGAAGKAGSQFSGQAFPYLVLPGSETGGTTINNVSFTPGARTFWHSHEKGQILIVVVGLGRIQSEGGPVQELRAGDTVWIPAGERHWHGAAPDSAMTHLAISFGVTNWENPVDDADYLCSTDSEGTHHDH
jgi:quercetin dioxygenase-like cupin family protein